MDDISSDVAHAAKQRFAKSTIFVRQCCCFIYHGARSPAQQIMQVVVKGKVMHREIMHLLLSLKAYLLVMSIIPISPIQGTHRM